MTKREAMRRRGAAAWLCGVLAAACLAGPASAEPKETVLYRFTGGDDGWSPQSPLVIDHAGNLYGTTTAGGTGTMEFHGVTGVGTVFRVAPPAAGHTVWHFDTLFHFDAPDQGWVPNGLLLDPASGMLYGTTQYGGRCLWNGRGGCGTSFSLSPPLAGHTVWGFKELYQFGDPSKDAALPDSPLFMDSNGSLYGESDEGVGPKRGKGTIYALNPPAKSDRSWTDSVLVPNDGGSADQALVSDESGALYGAAGGSIFKLTPPSGGQTKWTMTTIWSFPITSIGEPWGWVPDSPLIRDSAGALYGTTFYGGSALTGPCARNPCGVVYKLSPVTGSSNEWEETVLYNFQGLSDGAAPIGAIVFDESGALYGATVSGGATTSGQAGSGTVFKLTPPAAAGDPWTESVLHAFQGGSDGQSPFGGVIIDGAGTLYGTTATGGGVTEVNPEGGGTVFKITQ